MARIWYEKKLPVDAAVSDVNSAIGQVLAAQVYFVEVCSFRFRFESIEQINETLEYFQQKMHRTSRLPDEEWIKEEQRNDPKNYRRNIKRFIESEHDVIQRWYERLPMWLYEEPKRKKVVKALKAALEVFSQE